MAENKNNLQITNPLSNKTIVEFIRTSDRKPLANCSRLCNSFTFFSSTTSSKELITTTNCRKPSKCEELPIGPDSAAKSRREAKSSGEVFRYTLFNQFSYQHEIQDHCVSYYRAVVEWGSAGKKRKRKKEKIESRLNGVKIVYHSSIVINVKVVEAESELLSKRGGELQLGILKINNIMDVYDNCVMQLRIVFGFESF